MSEAIRLSPFIKKMIERISAAYYTKILLLIFTLNIFKKFSKQSVLFSILL